MKIFWLVAALCVANVFSARDLTMIPEEDGNNKSKSEQTGSISIEMGDSSKEADETNKLVDAPTFIQGNYSLMAFIAALGRISFSFFRWMGG